MTGRGAVKFPPDKGGKGGYIPFTKSLTDSWCAGMGDLKLRHYQEEGQGWRAERRPTSIKWENHGPNLILIFGILGSLTAAEGLNRLGSLAAAFDSAGAPFYMVMLMVSVLGAGVLLLALAGKSSRVIKWIMVVLFAGCIVLMLSAPSFPVNVQIFIGLLVAAGATMWIRPAA